MASSVEEPAASPTPGKEVDLEHVASVLDGGSGELEEEGLEDGFILSLDVDGPITHGGPSMAPYEEDYGRDEMAELLGGMKETVEELGGQVVLNSGKPREWLEEFVDEYSEHDDRVDDIDIIGGMGTEFRIGGEKYEESENGRNRLVETQQRIYRLAAQERLKINAQNNVSNDVMVNRFEAEGNGDSRGNTKENPTMSDLETTEELWENHLEEEDGFDYCQDYERDIAEEVPEGAIRADLEEEKVVDRLIELQRKDESFVGLRFEEQDGDYFFYRDSEDREYSGDLEDDEELHEEVQKEIERSGYSWEIAFHSDGGIEYWNGEACGKGEGVENYRRKVTGEGLDPEEVPVVHIGDSPGSDAYVVENGYFIPQEETDAEDADHPSMLEPRAGVGDMAKYLIGYAEG